MDNEASAFLRRLIPFPGSETLSPLSLLPMPAQGGTVQSDPVKATAGVVGEQAASIVSQAASILDEEMARGVLAARSAGTTAPYGRSDASTPALRQMHEFVDNVAALWPSLQGVAGPWQGTPRAGASRADPLPELKPASALRPGQRATISMTLCNKESRAIHLTPAGTDLLGSSGKRIASHLLALSPREVYLEPGEQRDMEIAFTIPAEVTPGCYSGLLVVSGVEYLRALIVVDVT